MPALLVDARTLLAVRETLGRLHDQLLAMPAVVSGFDGVLGGRGLEAELEGFCSDWQLAIVEIGGEIGAMMRRLGAAAEAYRRLEARLVGSGTTIVGPLPRRHHRGPRPGSQSGSGTTVVGPGGPAPGPRPGSRSLSGSGTTVVGPGSGSGSESGSGTTVIG